MLRFNLVQGQRAFATSQGPDQVVDEQKERLTPPPAKPRPDTDIPSKILEASLPFVRTYGWSTGSIAKGAQALGYLPVTHGLFPNGGLDLVDYFMEDARLKTVQSLEGKLEGLSTTEKVRKACITRLQHTMPYAESWPEAAAILAEPWNAPVAMRHLSSLVDDIWYLAGDKSFDFNWYTKRFLLSGVYTSTEMYMTKDHSPDFTNTLEFLDRRLEDVAKIGGATQEISMLASFGFQTARGILNSRNSHLIGVSIHAFPVQFDRNAP
ncbi:ubiquinone biosynthesis protein COQ9 [Basidiobolus meristosporus CBS 931.73]|uniref:Ubiquinone biosynthesis protein n=1 Tax=Basidiobolus meristosporus CBS 931.73 TaxID=1314790 RepID=A0A1Y1YYI0_9FUNG|nr:ubiquinone biosynthesis protein COQ9 [Basidiobolus meristosporus CBS 931.73]|eukprot:ORY03082.1 ubiquinone biosynthesis protein COQ9 [Basidiobolus meristosporus CBS 931.73]